MKFDPFGAEWRKPQPSELDLAIDIVNAVREAVGPSVDLAVEAHSRFSVETAISVGKRLEARPPPGTRIRFRTEISMPASRWRVTSTCL